MHPRASFFQCTGKRDPRGKGVVQIFSALGTPCTPIPLGSGPSLHGPKFRKTSEKMRQEAQLLFFSLRLIIVVRRIFSDRNQVSSLLYSLFISCISQEVDGKALLLMSRNDVLTGLRLKLGPALKLYHLHISKLQSRTEFIGL